jgi:hypothetical protein
LPITLCTSHGAAIGLPGQASLRRRGVFSAIILLGKDFGDMGSPRRCDNAPVPARNLDQIEIISLGPSAINNFLFADLRK